LLKHIEAATGKSITREPELFRPGAVVDEYDEEDPERWENESVEVVAT